MKWFKVRSELNSDSEKKVRLLSLLDASKISYALLIKFVSNLFFFSVETVYCVQSVARIVESLGMLTMIGDSEYQSQFGGIIWGVALPILILYCWMYEGKFGKCCLELGFMFMRVGAIRFWTSSQSLCSGHNGYIFPQFGLNLCKLILWK